MHIIMVIFATILIIQSYAIAESSEYIVTCNFIQNYQCCSKDTIGCTFLFYSFNSLIVTLKQHLYILSFLTYMLKRGTEQHIIRRSSKRKKINVTIHINGVVSRQY